MRVGGILVVLAAACLAVVAPAAARDLDAVVGKALFQRIWTPAGASGHASDGLGPMFNARSCARCHEGAGGGAMEDGKGLVLRFAGGSAYGRQLQTGAVSGVDPEGRLAISWRTELRVLADGTEVALRAPIWRIADAAYGEVPHVGSLRLAPTLAGLGKVAAVLAPGSGRRFGLKGDHPELADAVGDALLLDLGLATPNRPTPWGDCTRDELACRQAPQGAGDGSAELSTETVEAMLAYLNSLPPPQPAGPPDPAGANLFLKVGCAGCHQPVLHGLVTYSDFRAHDLGGDLADGDPADLTARSWRTPPLWGLGARLVASRPLLHDGRGRNALEAILWHGGAASGSVVGFSNLPAADRARLLDFLGRL